MRQRVNNEINSHTVSISRIVIRILRVVSMFIRITKISIPVNHDHETATVIENSFNSWIVTVRFPGRPTLHSLTHIWNLDDLFDIIKTIDFLSDNAGIQFVESLRQTGFAVLSNHPLDYKLITSVYDEWGNFFNSGPDIVDYAVE